MPVCSTCGTAYGSTVRICVRDGTPLVTGRTDNKYVGTLLDGKYRIESFISAGGMGSVYRAVHVMLDKTVAVKVIKNELVTSDEIVARFQREARAASNLEHPNIVTVYDLGQTAEGTLYIAMEFIDGPSLKEMIRKNGPLAPREAIDILRQVASALSAAHRKQVVHRDLKSDNLMLETDGDRKVVKLVDFGIAKTFDDSTQLTAAGYMLGTPHYMSPEQAAGKSVDHRADLYSLGVILYEMLTGELPFGDHALTSLLVKLATETPSPPSSRRPEHVPPALDAVAMRCLEKDPERRFQSADEFTAALNRALVEIEHPAATPPPIPGAEKTLLRPADGHQITNARAVTNVSTNLHQITQEPAAAHQVPTPPPVSEPHIPAASPRPGLDAASLAKRVAAVVVVLGVVVAAIVYGLRLRTTSPQENSPITTARQPQSTPAPQPITPAPVPVPVTPGATVPPAPAPVATAPPSPIDDGRGRVPGRNESASRSQAASAGTPPSPAATAARPAATAARPAATAAQAPPPVAQPQPSAAPAPPPAPVAPTPSPTQQVITALPISVACQGVADVCGVMRAETLRGLQESQVTGGDIEVIVKVALVSERPSTQFGTPSTVRTYSVDVTANSRGTAIAMPTPRVFGFDALFGRAVLLENARQIAAGAVEAVRAFKGKN